MLKEEFDEAALHVMKLSQRPSNENLLELYALFKQATSGNAQGKRPGLLDLKGRMKFDTWAAKKNMTAEQAMQNYVALVRSLS